MHTLAWWLVVLLANGLELQPATSQQSLWLLQLKRQLWKVSRDMLTLSHLGCASYNWNYLLGDGTNLQLVPIAVECRFS